MDVVVKHGITSFPEILKGVGTWFCETWRNDTIITIRWDLLAGWTLLPSGAPFSFFWVFGSDSFKLNQQKKGALFSRGHWASKWRVKKCWDPILVGR